MDDIVISFTPAQAWAWLLALAAAVATLEKACSVIARAWRKRKEPQSKQDKRICDLEEKVERIEDQVQRIGGLANESEKQREALGAILHDRIYSLTMFYIKQGFIDMDGLRNLEYLYDAYHGEGMNGTGTELFKRATSLPVREGVNKE